MTKIAASNEQSVIEAETQLAELRADYQHYLLPLAILVQEKTRYPNLQELLTCQTKAIAYFNFAEKFVANSGLLGAHAHGKWVTGLAENCYAILEEYLLHIKFMRSYKTELKGASIEPSDHAYANMQRMVKEYLDKKKSKHLRNLFLAENLPVHGFDMPAVEDEKHMRYVSVAIGAIAIIGVVVLAIVYPTPSRWQEFVFRGCLALGLASVAAEVPGFIKLSARAQGWGNYFKIFAGGALAIFVLIWLVNPPSSTDQVKEGKISDVSKADKNNGDDVPKVNASNIIVSTSGDNSPGVGVVGGNLSTTSQKNNETKPLEENGGK